MLGGVKNQAQGNNSLLELFDVSVHKSITWKTHSRETNKKQK